MKRFIADCKHCDWEGPVADTPEVAAVSGVGHMQEHHPAVLAEGDVSFVRVWEFQEMRVSVGTADITLEPEPAKATDDAAEKPEQHETKEHKRPAEGRKGR